MDRSRPAVAFALWIAVICASCATSSATAGSAAGAGDRDPVAPPTVAAPQPGPTLAPPSETAPAPPPAKPWQLAPRAMGRVRPGALAAAIRARRTGLAACYRAALRRDPTMAGKLTVEFVFGADGGVADMRFVRDTLRDGQVTACLSRRLARVRVPPPDGGPAAATHVFVLTAPGR